MDILGRERDRLQSRLDESQQMLAGAHEMIKESHQMLAEAHEMIKESHQKFLRLFEIAAKPIQSQSRDDQMAGAAVLFSQNRRRKPVAKEENNV